MSYQSVTVNGTETVLLESNLTVDGEVHATLDLVNIGAGETFRIRLYVKVDGTNYRLEDYLDFTGVQEFPAVPLPDEWANQDMDFKITAQRTVGSTDRGIGVRTRTKF